MVRGESLQTLPAGVKQFTPKGSINAYNNPVHRLIHERPNPYQTAAQFWKTVSMSIDLTGEAFCPITYSGRFQPIRIDFIPDSVQVYDDGDRLSYEHNGRIYRDWEMLHFKDMSLDGKRGISKIAYNAETIGYAKKLKTYGSNAIGIKPPGYFSTEASYDVVKKQEDNIAKGWKDKIAEGSTPLIPFGLKYNNLMINPGDAQYLDSIEATKEDIYAIFRVPPTLAQNYDRTPYNTAEQQDLVYLKYTMLPIVTNIEQECNAKLFSEANNTSETPFYVKFNTNAFMRGDFKTRTEGYRTLWQMGAINGDHIAELEDWVKWEGGDERFVPMNMIPLSKMDEFLSSLTKPVDSTAGDPGGDPDERMLDKIEKLMKRNGHVNGHAN
jgi:HK97 family phage portal protein